MVLICTLSYALDNSIFLIPLERVIALPPKHATGLTLLDSFLRLMMLVACLAFTILDLTRYIVDSNHYNPTPSNLQRRIFAYVSDMLRWVTEVQIRMVVCFDVYLQTV